MSVVAIENVGAIESIAFDLPDDRGGVRLFVGDNGRGKTTALAALSGLLGYKVALEPRDGEESGVVSGMGRKLRVSKRQSVTGSTKVPHLGDRLDVGKLVEPGVQDPAARDRYRIRALVSLCPSDVKPHDLISEELQDYVDMDGAEDIDDPVRMADFLKRSIDRAALEEEKRSDVKAELAKSKRVEAGDVDDLEGAVDMQSLAGLHREAMAAVEENKRKLESYNLTVKRNAEAEAKAKSLEDGYEGPSLKDAKDRLSSLNAIVEKMRRELAAAESDEAKAAEQLRSTNSHFSRVAELRSLVKDVGEPVVDNSAELEEAAQAAYQKLLGAEKLKDRKVALNQSKELQNESVKIAGEAVKLREAAAGLQAKIQELLPKGPIKIVDGNLVVEHARRGKLVLFDKLSEGERWNIALGYAIRVVGEGGVIPVTQESWQSLGEAARRTVLEVCQDNKVWLISAQVDDCPLTVVEYE